MQSHRANMRFIDLTKKPDPDIKSGSDAPYFVMAFLVGVAVGMLVMAVV